MTIHFQIGRTYSCRSICDHDCIFSFEVIGRTDKTVTIKSQGRVTRRKVRLYDGAQQVEQIDPLGRYSMSPVLFADRAAA